ncbi:hypothetical protein GGR57DRAFT_451891 [Xylariaceae sp. FL1272]|nr:hypothetical protein GGR57DRAFT_451891 [Xylariaceae sp. FL1272]
METEVAQILRNVTDAITCLMRLSVSNRNPASYARFRMSDYSDASHYDSFDTAYIREKFPVLNQDLCVRLGKVTSGRCQPPPITMLRMPFLLHDDSSSSETRVEEAHLPGSSSIYLSRKGMRGFQSRLRAMTSVD